MRVDVGSDRASETYRARRRGQLIHHRSYQHKAERVLGEHIPGLGRVSASPTSRMSPDQPGLESVAAVLPDVGPMPLTASSFDDRAAADMALPRASHPLAANPVDVSSAVLPWEITDAARREAKPRTARHLAEGDDRGASPDSTVSGKPSILVVLRYRKSSRVPRCNQVVVPSRSDYPRFDDERLFELISTKYGTLRGPVEKLVGLRTLKTIRFMRVSQVHSDMPTLAKRLSLDDFGQPNLLELYHDPRRGRGRHSWVEWVHRSSTPPSGCEDHQEGEARLALEFVEGLAIGKMVLVYAVVLAASISAGVMWIIYGVESSPQAAPGWKGAGARVQTGIVLASFVLGMGCSGVAVLWIAS